MCLTRSGPLKYPLIFQTEGLLRAVAPDSIEDQSRSEHLWPLAQNFNCRDYELGGEKCGYAAFLGFKKQQNCCLIENDFWLVYGLHFVLPLRQGVLGIG